MEQGIIKLLQLYGLSEKEAQLYFTTLKIWSVSASTLAQLTNIKRVTAYSVLMEMQKKWYIYGEKKGWQQQFQAVSINELIRSRKEKIIWEEKILMALQDAIPIIRTCQLSEEKGFWIQIFSGILEIKQLYMSILEKTDIIYAFIWSDHIDKELEKYLYLVNIPLRVSKQIFAQIIVSHTPNNIKYAKYDREWYKETRICSVKEIEFGGEINLFDQDKIAIIMYAQEEMYWAIIQSKHVYRTLFSIHQFLRNISWTRHPIQ